MGQPQSKLGKHRKSNNRSTSSLSSSQSQSSPQILRAQQLQQQRYHHQHHHQHQQQQQQQQQQQHRSRHSTSQLPSTILHENQQQRSSTSFSPSNVSISQPILIEEDDDSTYECRLSIDFYSNDTMLNTTNLIRNHIMEESRLSTTDEDRLFPSDLAKYVSSTLSSSSSSTISLGTAAFSSFSSSLSTASSMSSTFSSIDSKIFSTSHPQHRRSSVVSNITQATTATEQSHLTNKTALNSSESTSILSTPTLVDINNNHLAHFNNCQQLAKNKHVEAYFPLALCLYYGLTPHQNPDYPNAYYNFQKSIRENIALLKKQPNHPEKNLIHGVVASSLYCIGEMIANGKGVAKNEKKSAKYFIEAANEYHYPPAQHIIGNYYRYGKLGYEKDLRIAYKWYSAAAKQGYAKSQSTVGDLLFKQIDNEISIVLDTRPRNELIQQALYLLKSAAEKGNADASLQLALLYEVGRHVQQNLSEGFDYYERFLDNSNEKKNGAKHYILGINYRHGSPHFLRDEKKAVKHFRRSAEAGHPQAQRVLGIMYLEGGSGVTKNESIAHELFVKAAAQGDILALCYLGKQYESGRGCIKNTKEAIRCYEKAAQRSEALPNYCVPAQLALALVLNNVDRQVEAYKWFQKVATFDNFQGGMASPDLESMYTKKLTLYRNTAQFHIALYQLHGYGGIPQNVDNAFNLIRRLADAEDYAEAQYRIGCAFKNGMAPFIDCNPKLAYDYFRKAAKLNHKMSQFLSADMLSNGFTYTDEHGVIQSIKDQKQAYYLYASASTQGHPLSTMCEAVYFLKGLPPVDRDLARAEGLLRSAIIRGLPEAIVYLSQILIKNPDTVGEAYTWLLEAAKRNDTSAMRELAKGYEEDYLPVTPGKTKYQEGYEWLEKATVLNDPKAWFQLSFYHQKGWHVPPNIQIQHDCLIKSEDLGYIKASFAIANLYESQGEREHAYLKYTSITENHNLTSQYGWHARLRGSRLVVLHSLRDQKEQMNIYTMLQEMVEHGSKEDTTEPLELLGICSENGIGTSCNTLQAIAWYRKAISVQTSSSTKTDWAQDRTRVRLAKLLIDQNEHTEALHHLLQLQPRLDRMKGHQESLETVMLAREAQYYLGYLFLHGQDVETNEIEAKKCLTVAADQGHGNAAYELGLLAVQEEKYDEAQRCFNQGETNGHAGSMRELGMVNYRRRQYTFEVNYRNQQNEDFDDVDDDDTLIYESARTKDLLEAAENSGDAAAVTYLGLLHQVGFSTAFPIDLNLAIKKYNQALGQGHLLAAIYRGEICNADANFIGARMWYNRHPTHWIARYRLATYGIRSVGETNPDIPQSYNELRMAIESTPAPTLLLDRKIWSEACVYLGNCYRDGKGMTQDFQRAFDWYTLGIDTEYVRNVDGMVEMGLLYKSLGRYEDALFWFQDAAARRDMRAQFEMGLLHMNGFDTFNPNPMVAEHYLTAARDQGHGEARYYLAGMYWESGKYSEGWNHYVSAADEHNIPDALREVGLLYDQGFAGTDRTSSNPFLIVQNRQTAFQYFGRAAALGDGMSITMVGSYYQEGYEPFEGDNMEHALRWYQTAFLHPGNVQNRPILQLVIGRLVHIMANRTTDMTERENYYRQAYPWFEMAVAETAGVQTSPAEVMVALYHLNGWPPVERNPEFGFRELLRIEREGDVREGDEEVFREVARYIAQCYEEGNGVEQDYNQALNRWIQLAGFGDQEALERIERYHQENHATAQDLEGARIVYREALGIETRSTVTGSSYSYSHHSN